MAILGFIHPKKIIRFLFPNKWERKARADYRFLKKNGVDTDCGSVVLLGKPIIYKHPQAKIRIGKGVVIVSTNKWGNHSGINHPAIIAAETPGSEIIIEDKVGISGSSIMAVEKIVIGEGSMIGANSNIWDTDSHCIQADTRLAQTSIIEAPHSPVLIGKRCWVGGNATILRGVSLGDETVVGAMSLVAHSFPKKTVIAGNPAKEIKQLD